MWVPGIYKYRWLIESTFQGLQINLQNILRIKWNLKNALKYLQEDCLCSAVLVNLDLSLQIIKELWSWWLLWLWMWAVQEKIYNWDRKENVKWHQTTRCIDPNTYYTINSNKLNRGLQRNGISRDYWPGPDSLWAGWLHEALLLWSTKQSDRNTIRSVTTM